MSNPAFKDDVFLNAEEANGVMTLNGTMFKTALLLLITLISGAFIWSNLASDVHTIEVIKKDGVIAQLSNIPSNVLMLIVAGCVLGFITALTTIFIPKISPITAPIYALLEGVALGAFSVAYSVAYGNSLVFQTIFLTFAVFFAMLLLYVTRIAKVTGTIKTIVIAGTGIIAIAYLSNFFLSFFGINLPLIDSTSVGGILFSVVVIFFAAYNLALDFDFIEKGIEQKSPKYLEWYAGFGILVTLVWLYVEIFKFLAKIKK